jgi:hypothetical protein
MNYRKSVMQRKTDRAAANSRTDPSRGELAQTLAQSPAMIAQRKGLQSAFGTVQRATDKELAQTKSMITQRQGEDELMQGKFVAQREEDEMVQGKFAPVQRVEDEEPTLQGKFVAQREEDELTQGKFVAQREEDEMVQGKFASGAALQRAEVGGTPNDTGLPDNLKSGIESLSGMSMDRVKVHYDSDQPAQLNALAYAQGTDIHVAPGQEQHLPHEAWHVVQQAQGRVKPTMQMNAGVPVNDDPSLEHEADVMGARALDADATGSLNTANMSDIATSAPAAQLFKVPEGLVHLTNQVTEVSEDIKQSGSTNDLLYGAEQWGNDTYWAANRKLDEWNLVKELVKNRDIDVDSAARIGFGINDTSEADGIGYDTNNNVAVAGENKLVSGGFSQIVENINNAFSQLTEGSRATQYNGIELMARIHVAKVSEAHKHLAAMEGSTLKAQRTRWLSRLKNAFKEGCSNWSGRCSLRLLISSEEVIHFDVTIDKLGVVI